jgi:hypothetical protein
VNVQDFAFDVTDAGKVVTTCITFNPTFNSAGASGDANTAKAFYNTTLLRNSLTEIESSVYLMQSRHPKKAASVLVWERRRPRRAFETLWLVTVKYPMSLSAETVRSRPRFTLPGTT